MANPQSSPRAPRRWPWGLGLAMLGLLGILCIAVPLLFWSSSVDGLEPPPPAPPLDVSAFPAPRPPVTTRSTATRPARPPQVTPPPVPTGPIVDRRRTQEGAAPQAKPAAPPERLPPRPPGGPLPGDPAEEEWDRSEEARRRGVTRYGGSQQTEGAVEAGLAWLAVHQAPDGTWSRLHFDRQCPAGDRCGGVAVTRLNVDLDPGLTGLALLAFLGAGYTDQTGPYPLVVRGAVDALLQLQVAAGGFGVSDAMAGYNDALATLALAEYLALSGDDRVRPALERAAQNLVASQQALGGWDYRRAPNTGRNDSSITAWMVQALHACLAVDVDVPRNTLIRAALHFQRATEPDGRVRYADSGTGFRLDDNYRPRYQHGPGMFAAGLMSTQMLGWRLDAPQPLRQRGLLLDHLPSAARARGRDPTQFHSEYYWYYGTLAMFQRGGQDWERWNARLRDEILPLQERELTRDGLRKHTFGSWVPFGPNWGLFGRMGGRVYATAIATLTLEIYYRHTPTFLTEDVLFSAGDWRTHLAEQSPRERLLALEVLRELRLEVAEPVLVDLLRDTDLRLGLGAAAALAEIDSPLGVPLLDRTISTLPPWEQPRFVAALERGRAVLSMKPTEGHVRYVDGEQRLATIEISRSYVGMRLTLRRGDRDLGELRVVQRFTGRTLAVAEWSDTTLPILPTAGDRLVGR